MSDNPYRGSVTVDLDGKPVTLRFTWAARATLRHVFGEAWLQRVSSALVTLDPADLAVMLDAAANGDVNIGELMASDPSLGEVAAALRQAFRFAHHGLTEPEIGGHNPDPMKPRQMTWLQRLRGQHPPGSQETPSGKPRHLN